MKRAALVLLSLLAAACTPMEWIRADATPEQVAADMKACRQQAWREATWLSFNGYYRTYGPFFYDPFGRPYHGWPYYSPFADPWDDRFLQESRLTDFCMRAKGYALEPVKK